MWWAAFWLFASFCTGINAIRAAAVLWPVDLGLALSAPPALAFMSILFFLDARDAFQEAKDTGNGR